MDVGNTPPQPPPVPLSVKLRNRTTCSDQHGGLLNMLQWISADRQHDSMTFSLHEAAHSGDLQQLRNLLSKKDYLRRIDLKNHLGCTPLRLAASAGHADCVEFLLSLGASVDITDVKAQTALQAAVKHKKSDCVKILLEAGANPDGDPQNMCTPLHWAIQLGNCHNVQLLLDYGCDINGLHPNFQTLQPPFFTPLHSAITYRDKASFRALLDAGAMTAGYHGDCESPLYLVAMMKHQDDVSWVHDLYEYGVPFRDYDRLLMKALQENSSSATHLVTLLSHPRSLLSRSRLVIRGKVNRSDLRQLPLPAALIKCLQHG